MRTLLYSADYYRKVEPSARVMLLREHVVHYYCVKNSVLCANRIKTLVEY
ncbi:hypothetical protein JG687_00013816 [Phytophthora cactorum]|uniref:Uncharacterized protein n=1 Tax=Phytophthora cactorum TaxID=29920 RepID=A0A8T1TYE7_9STRA|nr:hypothetical protein JG687_00013816 [Phytophthora cactorum]